MVLSSTGLAQGDSEVIVAAEDITLTIDFGNGTAREFNDLNGSTVLEVTSSVLEVEVQWFGPLAYIKSIEGLTGEGEYGWEYWVNDEFASIAVNLYSLENICCPGGCSRYWRRDMVCHLHRNHQHFDYYHSDYHFGLGHCRFDSLCFFRIDCLRHGYRV